MNNAPSLVAVLEYLYDKFILTFILCLIGAIIRETMSTIKMTSIDIRRMMASVIMSSTIMCLITDYVDFRFSIYIVICIISGVWSPFIMKLILDSKIMIKLAGAILGGVKSPIAKTASEAINELSEAEEELSKKDEQQPNEIKEDKSITTDKDEVVNIDKMQDH